MPTQNKTYNSSKNITPSIMKNILINKEGNNGNNKYSKLPSLSNKEQPHLIIKYGPPASGKGSSKVQEEIKNLGIDTEDCIIFEIDRIIESLENFRTTSMEIYKESINYNEKTKKISQLYFNKRKSENSNKKTLNQSFEDLLIQSINERKNIIFETTGGSFNDYNPIKWLFDIIINNKKENPTKKPYYITLIYPIVKEENILERAKKRASNQVSRNPPFFRGISSENLKNQIQNAKHNFCFSIVPMLLYFNEIDKIIAFKND